MTETTLRRATRTASGAMLGALASVPLVLLLGCGSSEEPAASAARGGAAASRPGASQARPSAAEKPGAKRQLNEVELAGSFKWPPDKGEAPSLKADFEECRKAAERWGDGLAVLSRTGDCMLGRGWERTGR